ncbi:hypothetical protein BCS96_09435 [Vibrio breoganii]|uniref:Uncharacterized protein n=1 Tax=Vibrio breoganii TaxID=553239 RepID=A0ABX1U6W8_9VIBR|nr:hypothetical protein [Vibrio breoganii]NMO72945.1 hypothetical protein [Vibrio breoganii]NMR68782.1 hypothetical protein [Vibrio breoganii]PMF98590.1 hypothetical protein BCV08_01015 [Vibrio breoganii]PMG03893.1 hypothetical protein BCV02_01015 [Vibrio breoganii]PMG40265.1 hypothetical protein BCU93_01240 [Vibrio breoganii]
MSNPAPTPNVDHLQQQKTQWLLSQIDVAYPTRESVLGKACYLDLMEKFSEITSLESAANDLKQAVSTTEWLRADFHKLTVLFARFMASHSDIPEASREFLQEFLAQIILDDQGAHSLCLGFEGSEVVGACIVSSTSETILVSDLLLKSDLGQQVEVAAILNLFDTEMNQGEQSCPVFLHTFAYV